MPQPTAAQVHVDRLLTDHIIGTRNVNFIADQCATVSRVMKQSGLIPKLDRSHWFRDQATVRAPGTESQVIGFKVDNTTSYFCNRYSISTMIPDEVRANADDPYNLDREAADLVTAAIRIRREVLVAADVFGSSWTTTVTGAVDFTQWDNFAGSDPLVNIEDQMEVVGGLIAMRPNVFVLGSQVMSKLKYHPDVVDLTKYTQNAQTTTTDLLASLTGLPTVLVGSALYTTSVEGTAEASVSYSRIWGKNAALMYIAPTGTLISPTALKLITWNRAGIPNSMEYIVRYRRDTRESDQIEANTYLDSKITEADAGLLFSAAVS